MHAVLSPLSPQTSGSFLLHVLPSWASSSFCMSSMLCPRPSCLPSGWSSSSSVVRMVCSACALLPKNPLLSKFLSWILLRPLFPQSSPSSPGGSSCGVLSNSWLMRSSHMHCCPVLCPSSNVHPLAISCAMNFTHCPLQLPDTVIDLFSSSGIITI